jgi:hypothetical protein
MSLFGISSRVLILMLGVGLEQTGELTWETPPMFKSEETKARQQGEFYWVPDQTKGFVPGKLKKKRKTEWTLEVTTKEPKTGAERTETVSVNDKSVLPLVPVVWSHVSITEQDMVRELPLFRGHILPAFFYINAFFHLVHFFFLGF